MNNFNEDPFINLYDPNRNNLFAQAIQSNHQSIQPNTHQILNAHPFQSNTVYQIPQTNIIGIGYGSSNHLDGTAINRSLGQASNFQFHLNQLTTHHQQQQTNSNELIWLENFIISADPKSKSLKKYCNACCIEISALGLEEHLKSNKHFNNRKKLNNQLLAVNLFQISKHYNKNLTDSLLLLFKNYESVKAVKLLDYYEFEDFLKKNLDLKFKLTLYGSIPNDSIIMQSDINLNIELLDEKDEANRDLLRVIKQLVKGKGSDRFQIEQVPNLDRHERAYILTKNLSRINLISIDNMKHSNLIGQYVEFDPRVKALMYCIRTWANFCELDSISKAAYRPILTQIMLIYFLQHCNQPVLPNFHKILEKNLPVYGEDDSKHHHIEPITNEELALVKQSWQTQNNQNIGELWIDFFKFYLFHFDHEKTYVNIVHHKFKEKTSKAFSVCDVVDGSIFSVIFNWRIHYERMNKLWFVIYKHSCFFPFPNVSTDNLDVYLQFIFSPQNFKNEMDFKLTSAKRETDDRKRGMEDRKRNQKIQFDLKQLWQLSIKFNFKVCIKQELEKFKKQEFNIRVNQQVLYPELPRYCVLCKSKSHFVFNCDNMKLPNLLPLDKSRMDKCALVVSLISDYYYKAKTVNDNQDVLKLIDEVKNSLSSSIQSIYKDAELNLYGSVLSGFGHIESDLDFALLFQPEDPNSLETNRKAIVKRIGNSSLRKNRRVTELTTITNARVPIIKLKYVTSSRSFECDISIENRLPFCNTHLLRIYCTTDNRVPKLGLMIKKFAKTCQICYANQGGLNSYAFNIMLIHFLQQCDPPVLPVLQELEVDKLSSEIINGWEVKYFQDIDRIQDVWPGYKKNKKSVGELFIEFFIYYTEQFDFDKYVVSIKQSSKLTKYEKRWTSLIAIEDPFLLTHNLSVALEISMVNYLKSSFILGRNHFTNFVAKGLNCNMRVEDLFNLVFNEKALKSTILIPFGKGCQVCFKIGHKKANCPELRNGQTMNEYHQSRMDEQFPSEFDITLNDIIKSRQNIQYLTLVEQFDNLLKFGH